MAEQTNIQKPQQAAEPKKADNKAVSSNSFSSTLCWVVARTSRMATMRTLL